MKTYKLIEFLKQFTDETYWDVELEICDNALLDIVIKGYVKQDQLGFNKIKL
jgi:hypothetical protein